MVQSFQHQFFEFLLKSQYYSAAELRAQQVHQLEQMARYAAANIPFYKTRLKSLFRPDGSFDFSRWNEVPILKRVDLLEHREEMLAITVPQGHGPTQDYTGSGSTGKRVTTRHTALCGQLSNACAFRAWKWHGVDPTRNKFAYHGESVNSARGPSGVMTGTWGPSWDLRSSGKRLVLHHVEPTELALRLMIEHDSFYLDGRPDAVMALAKQAIHEGKNHKIGAIFAFGAGVTEATRTYCLEAFDAPVVSRYASKEAYDIACQCPAGRHHLNAELSLVEVLDHQDHPCAPGQMGRLIITPFYNTAQPLIRYDLGDLVTLGEACPCGVSLPVLSEINGRTVHVFRLPDGREVAPRLTAYVRPTIGAMEWQIAQVGPEAVELRYIKVRDATKSAFDQLTKAIQTQLTSSTTVKYRPVDRLPETPSGKILEVVCELPRQLDSDRVRPDRVN